MGRGGTYTKIHPPHAKLERRKHLPRGLGRGRGTAKEGFHHAQSTQKRGGGGGGLHGCGVLATCTRARAQKADVTVVEKGEGRGWSMSWRWLERPANRLVAWSVFMSGNAAGCGWLRSEGGSNRSLHGVVLVSLRRSKANIPNEAEDGDRSMESAKSQNRTRNVGGGPCQCTMCNQKDSRIGSEGVG